jgi:hypothetical protein
MPRYAENMSEMHKVDSMNSTEQPLQTCLWRQTDLKKLRDPPPKKKKQKLVLTGAVKK